MDKWNWYSGQTVMDTHMDDAFENVWLGERNLRIGHSLSQALAAATPNPTRYGGILSGGVVTRKGVETKTIEVTDLVAIDQLGRRITLGGTAEILLSHAGEVDNTEIGDLTPTIWSGGAITVPVGEERWLSLWVGYAELLSDAKTDIAGNPVFFQVDESFLFKVELGASAAPKAVDRAALVDGWVLLDDILIEEVGGDYQIKTVGVDCICGTNEELDVIVYGPDDVPALSGRRSDWLVCEDVTNFPQAREATNQVYSLRQGSPRDAISNLLQTLQRQVYAAGPPISPVGTQIIGSRAQAGAGLTAVAEAASSLPVGALDEQLLYLLDEINKRLGRGGGSIIPPAANWGVIFNPTSLDSDHTLQVLMANVAGLIQGRKLLGGLYGHDIEPARFRDHFLTYMAGDLPLGGADPAIPWMVNGSDAGTFALEILDAIGGVAQLQTGNTPAINENVWMRHMNGASPCFPWSCGASPWCIWQLRLRVASIAEVKFNIGMYEDAPAVAGVSALHIYFDSSVDNQLRAIGQDQAGAPGTPVVLLNPLDTNWHTIRYAARGVDAWLIQIDNNAWVSMDTGAGNFNTTGYVFGAYLETLAAATEKTLDFDVVDIAAGSLNADEAY